MKKRTIFEAICFSIALSMRKEIAMMYTCQINKQLQANNQTVRVLSADHHFILFNGDKIIRIFHKITTVEKYLRKNGFLADF